MNLSAVIVAILVLALLIDSGIRDNSTKKAFGNITLFVVCSLLVFAAAFRAWTVGSDTITFVDDYNSMNSFSVKTLFEQYYDYFPFYFLSWLLVKIGAPIFLWFGLIEFIYLFAICKFIKQFSTNRLFSFFCFFTIGLFFPSFNILKQVFAISFSLLSFCAATESKYYKALALFGLAVFSHKSALVFLLVYLIYFFRSSQRLSVFIVVSILIVGYIGEVVWSTLVGGLKSEHFDLYLESDELYNSTMLYYLTLLACICLFLLRDYK